MVRVRDAATVILVRDRPDLHVFVLRRNPALDFAPGATVFPGGAVDPQDSVTAAALGVDRFRTAAARECLEEAGIPLDARDLVEFARWITPEGAPRRYDTRFFVARAPEGHDGVHDGSELVASAWMRPAEVLDAFARGAIDLILPTQRSLEVLARFDRVEALLAEIRGAPCPT
ncbi:MAG TPA: NUDIX hydrolase [Acidimicrobiia bacterium]|nr:NUDIX hydrolase [Acidimicrobiia bacterium]